MTLEHYPGMTEKALEAIVAEAKSRWDISMRSSSIASARLQPADQIVLVAVTSAHRGEAFAACEFIMDYLKTRAPFWKKEDTAAGRALGRGARQRRRGRRTMAARLREPARVDRLDRALGGVGYRRVAVTDDRRAALIAIDWGTTPRARIASTRGAVVGERSAPLGIQQRRATGSSPRRSTRCSATGATMPRRASPAG